MKKPTSDNRRFRNVSLFISHEEWKIYSSQTPDRFNRDTQLMIGVFIKEGYSFAIKEINSKIVFPDRVSIKILRNYVELETEWFGGTVEEHGLQGFFSFYCGL